MATIGALSTYTLPKPRTEGEASLEHSLLRRRSMRDYVDSRLTLEETGQLLWAAQGITAEGGLRTAPSAGALYPLEIYLTAGNVQQLPAGLYHYRPESHELALAKSGDLRRQLAEAALDQDCVRACAAIILFTADYARTSRKYGPRASRYVHIEIGHAAQNVCLQATALDLGTVTVGAFRDETVTRITEIPAAHKPIYLVTVGRPLR